MTYEFATPLRGPLRRTSGTSRGSRSASAGRPEFLGPEEIRTYLLELLNAKRSRTVLIQNVCVLRFLYQTTLQRTWPEDGLIPFPKKERRFPVVLSRVVSEVRYGGLAG